MRQLLICNYLFLKRNIRKLSLILLLALIPILCFTLNKAIKKDTSSSITAGIYAYDNTSYAKTIIDNMTSNYRSVRFERCKSVSEIKEKVISGEYECGYVLKKDFNEKLVNAQSRTMVTVYKSPSTIASAITSEYLFSEIFRIYAYNKMLNYINKNEFTCFSATGYKEKKLQKKYNYYMDSDETFSFEYVNPAKGEVDSDIIITSFTLNSVRGIIALLVMLASFIGVMNLYKDNDHKIFFAFKGIKRPVAMILEILNITILAGISGVASIYLCEIDEGLINEITRMLIYALLSSLYFYII